MRDSGQRRLAAIFKIKLDITEAVILWKQFGF